MGKEASTLGNASGECATPTEFITDRGPRRSQPSPLASNGPADGPEWALSRMPSRFPPTLASSATEAAHTVTHRPRFVPVAVEWLGLPAGRRLPPTRYSEPLLMSGSFVHKSTIAGCRCFASHLPSGPYSRGCRCRQRGKRTHQRVGGIAWSL
jgi:hypothetical protein